MSTSVLILLHVFGITAVALGFFGWGSLARNSRAPLARRVMRLLHPSEHRR